MKNTNSTNREDLAFPHTNSWSSGNGMSLRDYFASKALQGLVANGEIPTDKHEVARVCYEYADALLLIRNVS